MSTAQSETHDQDRGATGGMDRVTLRLPSQQLEGVEQRVDAGEFPNRSEAIRAAVRKFLSE